MKPKPIEPKRADFSSFDDYFHAMIQYHLGLTTQELKEVSSFLTFSNPAKRSSSENAEHSVCKNCTNNFECKLRKFSVPDREQVCLVFREQERMLRSPHQYTSGKVRLPEERNAWGERLRSFMEEHVQ